MAINFPDSPSTNDTHTVGDKTWTWNATYWHLNQNTSTYYAQDGVPSSSTAGDFWFESDSGQLFVRYDSAWVEIGHATDFGSSLTDADGDTLVQVEEGSDEDIIRFDTAGTERMTIAANGAVNVGGTLTAGAFSGPLTGNVTGNASGTALTVTQAAQSAITSVGTLTALTVSGDLTVSGTTTTINSTTLTVDDKNIELGSVASPSDATADGGGITLKGASDKTILWTNSTDAWHFNQGINVTAGKVAIGAASANNTLDVIGDLFVGDTSRTYAGAASYGGLCFPRGEVFFSNTNTQNQLYLMSNITMGADGGLDAINTAVCAYAALDNGTFSVGVAGSTTAGAAPSFTAAFNVTNAGNVGIGTTAPALKLHVYTTASTDGILLDGSTFPAITLQGAGTTRGYIGVATGNGGFVNNSVTGDLIIRSDSTKLHLATAQSAASMTFSGTNVGIGTVSPTYRFQVAHPGTSTQGYFEGGWVDNVNSNSRLIFNDNNFGIGAGQIGSGSNEDDLVLWAYNGAGRGISFKGTSAGSTTTFQSMDAWMRITHDGKVGIGETAPASDLVVRADSAAGRGGEISIVNYAANTVGNEAALNFGLENSTYAGNDGNFQMKAIVVDGSAATDGVFSNWTGGAFTEHVRFRYNGYVGIGTATPQTKLQIRSAAAASAGIQEALRVVGAWGASGDGPLIRFTNYHGSGSNPNSLEYNLGAIQGRDFASNWGGGLAFQTPPASVAGGGDLADRMVIREGGHVGIGTSSPTCILNVSSSGSPVVRIDETGGSGDVYLQLMQSASNGEGLQFRYASATGHSYLTSIYSGGHMYLQTANSTRMTIASDGRVAIGTAVEGQVPNLTLGGTGASEGGQLNFKGGTSYGTEMYLDRYGNNLRMIYGGASKFEMEPDGDCFNVNGTYGQYSDERLKTDITPARNYLPDLLNLEVVNFVKDKQFVIAQVPVLDSDGNQTYEQVLVVDGDGEPVLDEDGNPTYTDGDAILTPSDTDGTFEALDEPSIKQLGMVAQQVEAYIPGLVSTDQFGVKAFKSSILVPMLLQAVQTLTARIETLESA